MLTFFWKCQKMRGWKLGFPDSRSLWHNYGVL